MYDGQDNFDTSVLNLRSVNFARVAEVQVRSQVMQLAQGRHSTVRVLKVQENFP